MEQDLVLVLFEWVGGLIYVAAAVLALRQRNPYYLGLFAICNLMIFWDWIFNSKWFFNVMFHEDLTALWTIQGESETLAGGVAFVAFYYFVFHLLLTFRHRLDARLGRWQYPLLYVLSAVYVLVFESVFVNLGVWTYYQKPFYEFYGMAWSNTWFNSNLMVGSYILLRWFYHWSKQLDQLEASFRGESVLRPFTLSMAAVTLAFFISFALQMIWYINAQPWVESPRVF